jgi:hypothetical protein
MCSARFHRNLPLRTNWRLGLTTKIKALRWHTNQVDSSTPGYFICRGFECHDIKHQRNSYPLFISRRSPVRLSALARAQCTSPNGSNRPLPSKAETVSCKSTAGVSNVHQILRRIRRRNEASITSLGEKIGTMKNLSYLDILKEADA